MPITLRPTLTFLISLWWMMKHKWPAILPEPMEPAMITTTPPTFLPIQILPALMRQTAMPIIGMPAPGIRGITDVATMEVPASAAISMEVIGAILPMV